MTACGLYLPLTHSAHSMRVHKAKDMCQKESCVSLAACVKIFFFNNEKNDIVHLFCNDYSLVS